MPRKDATRVQQTDQRRKFLHIAQRLFPTALTFGKYVEELNSHIQDSSERICLESDQVIDPAYARLLDRLYVAWPNEKQFPSGIVKGSTSYGSISIDQIIQNVITSTLRKYPSRYEAQSHNILCNGFSLGSPHGKGSVFQNLDSRSSSSQVQFLRSPAWKQLLHRIGPDLLRHMLANNILLLSVLEEARPKSESPSSVVPQPTSSVFLQLCGPPPKECSKQDAILRLKSASSIVLQRDLLYQTPSHRETALTRSMKSPRSRDAVSIKFVPYNSGLPKSHHLQGLSGDVSSAKRLLSVIFKSSCFRKPTRSEKSSRSRLGTQKGNTDDGIRKGGAFNFDVDMSGCSGPLRFHARGKEWLRERKQFHKRLIGIVPVLQKVIKRTHSSCFRRLLGSICPLHVLLKQYTSDEPVSSAMLMRLTSKPKLVAKFVIACTRQIVPTELFGSERNRDGFEKAVHNFVRRRLKRESFNVRRFSAQDGFVVSDVKWLYRRGANGKKISNPTELMFRQSRIEEVYIWLFRGLVLPLTHQSFYITEGDLHRNRLFYFRREVWAQLMDTAFESLLRADRKFSILSKEALAKCTFQRANVLHTLGSTICPYPVLTYHNLRFVPKRSSLRGIQRPRGKMFRGFAGFKKPQPSNLGQQDSRGRTPGTITKAKTSMKSLFRHVLRILGTESHAKATSLGASVFSLDDIFERFLALKQRWLWNDCPSLYVCSVDIATSFDTIPLETLFSDVVPSILTKERYVALRYGVAKRNIATGRITQRYFIYVCSEPGEEASFSRVVRQKLASDHAGAIFTDLVQATTLRRDQILRFLTEFLATNIVAIPKRSRHKSATGFAVQCRGLPQGNQLSPLLTSLFYAHVENQDLAVFSLPKGLPSGNSKDIHNEKPDLGQAYNQEDDPCLLMRQVDDTIFFTSDKAKAIQFLKRMVKGWKVTHGFCVNVEKTKSNFTSGLGGEKVEHMPWCGLIIDASSLQVKADYSRYGQHDAGCLRDSLFIEHDIKPGTRFAERAWTCFKPKLHPVLLDSRLNSRATVALNLYQAALLACLKVSSYASVILPREKHLSLVIEVMTSKFVELVTRSVCSRTAITHGCRLPLSQVEVRYITLHAFRSGIIKKLRNRRKMRKRIRLCQRMLEKNLDELRKRVRRQKDSSIEAMAGRISETACQTLWTLRL